MIAALNDQTTGLSHAIAAVAAATGSSMPPIPQTQVFDADITLAVAEKLHFPTYPCVYVWMEKAVNKQTEFGALFSGTMQVIAQVRVTADKLPGLARITANYGDAIANVLKARAGDWGNGLLFGGAFEQRMYSARAGGRGAVQACSVILDLDASE